MSSPALWIHGLDLRPSDIPGRLSVESGFLLWYIHSMPTAARIRKVRKVLSHRQPDLRVVLEEVTNTHNASAVVRTCDAAGILYLEVVSSSGEPFPVNEAISTRAEKWLEFRTWSSTAECLNRLKQEGFTIAATSLREDSIPYWSIDYTQPLAIVFGNESEGISTRALQLADKVIRIPMLGMVQSLNLSVSVGIILYEAIRQRKEKGVLGKRRLPPGDLEELAALWLGGGKERNG